MIILALELGIFRAVVPLPELLRGVERRGVQALLAAERAHLVLDLAVVMAVRGAGRQRHGAPEAEVDVDLPGPQRVQRPGGLTAGGCGRPLPRAGAPQPQRAHPHPAHANPVGGEAEELRAPPDPDLPVLDYVLLRWPPA